eukprot:Awhi_evm1s14518
MTVDYGLLFSSVTKVDGVFVKEDNLGTLNFANLDVPSVTFSTLKDDKFWFTLALTNGKQDNSLLVLFFGIFVQCFLSVIATVAVVVGLCCHPGHGCNKLFCVLMIIGLKAMFIWDIIVICLANNWKNNGFNVPGAEITAKGTDY